MQWKQMNWPLVSDSLNLLGVSAVPITVAVDEHGIIRQIRPNAEEFERDFLDREFSAPDNPLPESPSPPDLSELRADAGQGSMKDKLALGDALVLWGRATDLGEAIQAYENVLEQRPDHAQAHFRLGVAYRKRYDSDQRQQGDFQRAVEHWQHALDLDPNQYIWRRRIQQYGPRLDKPYPFYDWINDARREIQARGETPVSLTAEPGGAEFAHPTQEFDIPRDPGEEPDPKGRINRDTQPLVLTEQTVVPPAVEPGQSARVHVVFRPNPAYQAHWNNEQPEGLVFWVAQPERWKVSSNHLTAENPSQPLSTEKRRLEFEVQVPEGTGSGRQTIPAYGLYYVCEGINGTCLYRRQDVPVTLTIK
jgi:hypothetical protein